MDPNVARMDHDQRFKRLIQTFFAEFLELFFAPWAARLDAKAVEWLDKEIFPDPPDGPRRVLDLVGKLPVREAVKAQRAGDSAEWLALVHIEIESPDKAAPLRPRMFDAYCHLRRQHQMPVLPIALYLRVGLNGLGADVYEEHFWELKTVEFRYLYVGLPALDAVEYVQRDNWLGVALAALMKVPKEHAALLGAEALRRLVEAPLSDLNRFLLSDCFRAYFPLDEAQQREFERLTEAEPYRGVKAMNVTAYDKGTENGLRIGLRASMRRKFGAMSETLSERLDGLTVEQMVKMQELIVDGATLEELLREFGK